MAGMSDPRDLFLHELGDVLYAENTLVKALPKLAEEASDEELTLGFEEHLEETRQHVKNIEQVFEQLGEEPKAEQCPGIDGIKKEHDEFVSKESPSRDVLDSFLTGAGARTEHYEIAAYEGLVTMAEAMGETRSSTCSPRTSSRRRPPSRSCRRSGSGWQRTGRDSRPALRDPRPLRMGAAQRRPSSSLLDDLAPGRSSQGTFEVPDTSERPVNAS